MPGLGQERVVNRFNQESVMNNLNGSAYNATFYNPAFYNAAFYNPAFYNPTFEASDGLDAVDFYNPAFAVRDAVAADAAWSFSER
jgi:hypothetical protein